MSAQAQASKLDIDKFAKVHRLIEEGATDGERAAARDRAGAMAQRAGMTLKDAVSKMDTKPRLRPATPAAASDWRDIFRGMDDWMEEKHPGYKAKQAEKKTAREERRAVRRRELLKRYGTVSAVFALNEIERALFAAAAPFAKRKINTDWCGRQKFSFTSELGGAGNFDFLAKAKPEAVAAMRDAWPMPCTLPGLLAEAMMWDGLSNDRGVFVDGEYQHHLEVYARMELLERELHNRQAETWDDVETRFAWEKHKFERQWIDPTEEKPDGLIMTLRRDFEMLRRRYKGSAQDGRDEGITMNVTPSPCCSPDSGTGDFPPAAAGSLRRTNADKRRDVLSMLDAEPGLSDREIARRCGVSPQTVGNLRRRLP